MSGTDFSSVHAEAIRKMLPQLLILLVNRLGGRITIPVDEIDGTGKFLLAMRFNADKREFYFEAVKKQ
jgi:hypothetical protein